MDSSELIKNIAYQTILVEQQALNGLVDNLDVNFINAVQEISTSKGRVVITGLGKSALVAQKIVATLNSTGTAAMFMHAADAVHGDLGMLRKEDILWCISKSGDTAEIKVLLPLVQQFGNTIMAFTSSPNSYLAQNANYNIHIPIEKEADPNNLAPTASTTAQMAMGDAVAMALLALRGFTSKDFFKFHPGGSLGKQLYLQVSDIYQKEQQPSVYAEDTLKQVILSMTSGRMGVTTVLNSNDEVLGIITDGDLRRMLEKPSDINNIIASEIMSKEPVLITVNAMAVEALKILSQKSISQLIVVKDHKYKGILHLHDLLREGIL